nr:immunoglobulin heavy chain junction region [Mus musculus]
IFLCLPRRVLR